MYWYCTDHQTCPSSYESWQDLFNLNKKGVTFSLKKFQKKFKVLELSKKNPIVQGVRISSWILQRIANNNFNNFNNKINYFETLTFVSDSFWIVFVDIT